MRISRIMRNDVEICAPEDNLAAVASRMWDCDIGCLPVVDGEGHVVGVVTDRDVCMAALTRGQALHEIPVSVAMSKDVLSCTPDTTLIEAEEVMRSGQVRRLPVIDSEACLVGIVSLNDFARLAEQEIGWTNRELGAQEVTATLAAVSAPRRAAQLPVVLRWLARAGEASAVDAHDRGRPLGVLGDDRIVDRFRNHRHDHR
jgi:CBS domain-containing protein